MYLAMNVQVPVSCATHTSHQASLQTRLGAIITVGQMDLLITASSLFVFVSFHSDFREDGFFVMEEEFYLFVLRLKYDCIFNFMDTILTRLLMWKPFLSLLQLSLLKLMFWIIFKLSYQPVVIFFLLN